MSISEPNDGPSAEETMARLAGLTADEAVDFAARAAGIAPTQQEALAAALERPRHKRRSPCCEAEARRYLAAIAPEDAVVDVETLAKALAHERAGVRTSWEGWLAAARDLAAEYARLRAAQEAEGQ